MSELDYHVCGSEHALRLRGDALSVTVADRVENQRQQIVGLRTALDKARAETAMAEASVRNMRREIDGLRATIAMLRSNQDKQS